MQTMKLNVYISDHNYDMKSFTETRTRNASLLFYLFEWLFFPDQWLFLDDSP